MIQAPKREHGNGPLRADGRGMEGYRAALAEQAVNRPGFAGGSNS